MRTLDQTTKVAYTPTPAIIKHFKDHLAGLPADVQLPQNLDSFQLYSPGRSAENPFGYKGRTSILEELYIGPQIQELLNQEIPPTAKQLEDAAKSQGMLTMYQTGLIKCLEGLTTLEEINRVI